MATHATLKRSLLTAYQRAIGDFQNGFAPDPFRCCDLDHDLEETVEETAGALDKSEFRCKRAEAFDIPKGEFAVRPGVIVDVQDLAVVHKILAEFIVGLDRSLPSGVVAYRLKPDKRLEFIVKREPTVYRILTRRRYTELRLEESWYNLWPLYQRNLVNDLKSGAYPFVARTDITAFFEDINLTILGEVLKKKAHRKSNAINILIEIYRNWALRGPSDVRQDRGLPQGSNTSGILSNYYLDLVDQYLEGLRKRGRVKWYRYCDDIYVLCRSRDEAVEVLLHIGRLLRLLGLNQNAAKTQPLASADAIAEVINPSAEKVSGIIDSSQRRHADRDGLRKALRSEYERVAKKKQFAKKTETVLFRIYTAAYLLDDSLLTRRVGADFVRFPARSQPCCRYARRFINNMPVQRKMIEHLTKRALLHEYQLSFLLTTFRNLRTFDSQVFEQVLAISKDRSVHWYPRTQAIATLSYLGPGRIKKRDLDSLLSNKTHEQVRRAAITLLPMLGRDRRNEFVSKLTRSVNPCTSRMAGFAHDLGADAELAGRYIERFKSLHPTYVSDQIWILYFVADNPDSGVKSSLRMLLGSIERAFPRNKIIQAHLDCIQSVSDKQ